MDITPWPGGEWEKACLGGELRFLKVGSVLVGLREEGGGCLCVESKHSRTAVF